MGTAVSHSTAAVMEVPGGTSLIQGPSTSHHTAQPLCLRGLPSQLAALRRQGRWPPYGAVNPQRKGKPLLLRALASPRENPDAPPPPRLVKSSPGQTQWPWGWNVLTGSGWGLRIRIDHRQLGQSSSAEEKWGASPKLPVFFPTGPLNGNGGRLLFLCGRRHPVIFRCLSLRLLSWSSVLEVISLADGTSSFFICGNCFLELSCHSLLCANGRKQESLQH